MESALEPIKTKRNEAEDNVIARAAGVIAHVCNNAVVVFIIDTRHARMKIKWYKGGEKGDTRNRAPPVLCPA